MSFVIQGVVPRAVVIIRVVGEPVVTTFIVSAAPDVLASSPLLSTMPAKLVALEQHAAIISLAGQGWHFDRRAVLQSGPDEFAVLYQERDLQELARLRLTELLTVNRMLRTDVASRVVVVAVEVLPAASSVRYQVQTEGEAIPRLPYGDWSSQAGERITSTTDVIAKTPGVHEVSVVIWPSFWPFLPLLPQRFKFTLDIL